MCETKNHALIVLDSCRYDSFMDANTPNMDEFGDTHRVWSQGLFTLPAHIAFFTGRLPTDPLSELPYVSNNRRPFVLNNLGYKFKIGADLIVDGEDVIDGFNNLGYTTIGSGGVNWFDGSPATQKLIHNFKKFDFFGPFNIDKQLEWIIENLNKQDKIFLFVNIGVTHYPYVSPFRSSDDLKNRGERKFQIEAVEYVDKTIRPLLGLIRDWKVVITSDHGECFGEDGLYGHGLYHEKVMEVFIKYHGMEGVS